MFDRWDNTEKDSDICNGNMFQNIQLNATIPPILDAHKTWLELKGPQIQETGSNSSRDNIDFQNNTNDENSKNNKNNKNNKDLSMFLNYDKQSSLIRNIEILEYLLGTVAGKDKLAKLLKATLELLIFLISRLNKPFRILDEPFRKKDYSFSKTTGLYYKINIIILKPILILKNILVRGINNFQEKSSYVCDELSTFRYILRFGGSPSRLILFKDKIYRTMNYFQNYSTTTKENTLQFIKKEWLNEKSISEFASLYFGIFDELLLLNRLHVWSNKTIYNFVSRQSTIAAEIDLLLALKSLFLEYHDIDNKEGELKAQVHVRGTVLKLASTFVPEVSTEQESKETLIDHLPVTKIMDKEYGISEGDLIKELAKVIFKKKLLALDLAKTNCDFILCSLDFFKIDAPPIIHILLSFTSALAACNKMWKQYKNEGLNK